MTWIPHLFTFWTRLNTKFVNLFRPTLKLPHTLTSATPRLSLDNLSSWASVYIFERIRRWSRFPIPWLVPLSILLTISYRPLPSKHLQVLDQKTFTKIWLGKVCPFDLLQMYSATLWSSTKSPLTSKGYQYQDLNKHFINEYQTYQLRIVFYGR